MQLSFSTLLFTALGSICSCTAQEYRSILFKEPMPNKAMKNQVIKSAAVPNEGSCRVMCYMEPNCVSINVGPLEGGKHKCELNNATDDNQLNFYLEDKPAYIFLAIDNPCSSRPCMNNGTCQAGFTSKGFRCLCRDGFFGEKCHHEDLKRNCAEIYKSGEIRDGVYRIQPDNLSAFEVFCDQTTAGGGWTVFQKRLDGSVDFYLNWADYKHGFGHLNGEFWLGLDKIHRLTSDKNNKLRVDLEDFEGNTRYAEYNMFGVMSESDKYTLMLESYSGTAGDSLSNHRDQFFTTKDQDNDKKGDGNCAIKYHGAWWYDSCHYSNLNGLYYHSSASSYGVGLHWGHWRGFYYSLKRTEIKIRPVDF